MRRDDWLQMRLPQNLKIYLRDRAEECVMSITQYVINLIIADFNKHEK